MTNPRTSATRGARPAFAAASALAAVAAFLATPAALARTPAATVPTAAHLAAERPVVDPTIPPPGFGKHAMPGAGSDSAAPPPAARLQMIVRGPGETRMALIDGQVLHVGDLVRHGGGQARVLRITDAAVTLDRDGSRHTLELVPGASAAVATARSR